MTVKPLLLLTTQLTKRYRVLGSLFVLAFIAAVSGAVALQLRLDEERTEGLSLRLESAARNLSPNYDRHGLRGIAELFGAEIKGTYLRIQTSTDQIQIGKVPVFKVCSQRRFNINRSDTGDYLTIEICQPRVGTLLPMILGLFVTVIVACFILVAAMKIENDVLLSLNEFIRRQKLEVTPVQTREDIQQRIVSLDHAIQQKALLESLIAEEQGRLEIANQFAHDLSAPLGVISFATRHAATLDQENADLIQGAVSRIRSLSESLLDQAKLRPSYISADLLIKSITPELTVLYHSMVPSGAGFSILNANANPEGSVLVNHTKLMAVIGNLLKNAVEAKLDSCPNPRVTIAWDASNELALKITDYGKGIQPDVRALLFEKGVSFKNGNGLGLWDARNTLASWGGKIEIGDGSPTCVSVRLPLHRLA